MATLTINGREFEVDDSFKELPPETQEQYVNQIAAEYAMAGGEEPSFMDSAADIAGAAGAGLARGAAQLAGLPGTIADLGQRGVDNLLNWATGEEVYTRPSPFSGASIESGLSSLTGGATDYRGDSMPARYAGRVSEFVPGALALGGGGVGARLALGAAVPGAAYEATGDLLEGYEGAPYAQTVAALLSPMAVSRAISPARISPSHASANTMLEREGISQTAGQRVGSQQLRAGEMEIGGGATRNITERQAEEFTAAALRRAGVNANRATPEVISDAFDDIGKSFNALADRTRISFDDQIVNDVAAALSNYKNNVGEAFAIPGVSKAASSILDPMSSRSGVISGDAYKSIRSQLGRNIKGTAQPEAKFAYRDMQMALDDAVERSMPGKISPEWVDTRRNYHNLLTLEQAVTGAGEAAASGLISPQRLRQATISIQGRRNYARGTDNYGDLTRAGEIGLSSFPNSGTATRSWWNNVPTAVGGAIGFGLSGGTPKGTAAGALLGAASPYLAGRTLMSRPVQSYLSNQFVNPVSLGDPVAMNLLLGGSRSLRDQINARR